MNVAFIIPKLVFSQKIQMFPFIPIALANLYPLWEIQAASQRVT